MFRQPSCSLLLVAATVYFGLLPHLASHAQPASATTHQRLAAAKQARDENLQRLKSAVVTGTLRQSLLRFEDEQPEVLIDADLKLFYAAPKFVLQLQYSQLPDLLPAGKVAAGDGAERSLPWRRQTILFDGETLSSIQVAHDGQSMGELYFDFSRQAVLRAAGLPFEDPFQLWTEALDIDRSELQSAVTVALATGGFMGELQKPTYLQKFYFFGDFGYDLRRVSSYRLGEDIPFRDCVLHWAEGQGVHYVQRLVTRVETAGEVPGNRLQLEIDFDSCEINSPIDPQLFSLVGLELPEGMPFRDHRQHVAGKPKRLLFDGQQLVDAPQ